jgi:hypothetical protein
MVRLEAAAAAALHPKNNNQGALDKLAAEASEKRRRAAERARRRRQVALDSQEAESLSSQGHLPPLNTKLVAVGPSLSRWQPSPRAPGGSAPKGRPDPGSRHTHPGAQPVKAHTVKTHRLTGHLPKPSSAASLSPLEAVAAADPPGEPVIPLLEMFAQLRDIGVTEARLKKLVSREQLEDMLLLQTGRKKPPNGGRPLPAAHLLPPQRSAAGSTPPRGVTGAADPTRAGDEVPIQPAAPRAEGSSGGRPVPRKPPAPASTTAQAAELYRAGGSVLLSVSLVKSGSLGIKINNSCVVVQLIEKSAAAGAGLIAGAVITSVNGAEVADKQTFGAAVKAAAVGSTLTLVVRQPEPEPEEGPPTVVQPATAPPQIPSAAQRMVRSTEADTRGVWGSLWVKEPVRNPKLVRKVAKRFATELVMGALSSAVAVGSAGSQVQVD